MYLNLIFLSLFGSLITGFNGKFLGSFGAILFCLFCIIISFFFSICIFYEVLFQKCPVYIELFFWVNCEVLNIKWSFIFDSLNVIMFVVVNFISFLVHLYSMEYMSHDPHKSRFFSYLSLFTFFMLLLISADNFFQLFLGWEGVGLCSYLLINFWFTRIQANKAAIKAMIINRIGDFFLIFGILFVFVNFKTVDFSVVIVLIPYFFNEKIVFVNFLDIISLFLFIGASGKSAQIGLHTWLPDAMEGPTPVSALIHAATMVTAGIFLLVRVSFIFEHAFAILEIIIVIGVFTAFISSSIGLIQNDLKKVIAYSTCSQLGYMIFSCGLSNYNGALFHLANHAFFKALLFLSAGSVIHSVFDEQDFRKMGGLKKLLPFTYIMMLFGSLALMGFPFFSGFYSKDLIIESSYSKFNFIGYFSYYLGSFTAFLTSFYSIRLLFFIFLSKPNGFKRILGYSKESNNVTKFVLVNLLIPSLFIGYYTKDCITGVGNSVFFNFIFISFYTFSFDGDFLKIYIKILPVFLSFCGLILAFIFYVYYLYNLFFFKLSPNGLYFYNFINKKWYIDKIYNEILGQFFFKFGYMYSYKFLDRGFFEIIGATGLSLNFLNLSNKINNYQTNYLYHLTVSIVISFITVFFYKILFFFDFFNIIFVIIVFLFFSF